MTLPHVAWTWYVLIGALVTFAVGYVASILMPKPRVKASVTVALILTLLAPASDMAQAQAAAKRWRGPRLRLILRKSLC